MKKEAVCRHWGALHKTNYCLDGHKLKHDASLYNHRTSEFQAHNSEYIKFANFPTPGYYTVRKCSRLLNRRKQTKKQTCNIQKQYKHNILYILPFTHIWLQNLWQQAHALHVSCQERFASSTETPPLRLC